MSKFTVEGPKSSLVVEFDFLKIINLLNYKNSDLKFIFFCGEALSLAKFVNVSSFCKFPREENKVIYNLAILASSSQSFRFWLDVFPPIVISLTFEMG